MAYNESHEFLKAQVKYYFDLEIDEELVQYETPPSVEEMEDSFILEYPEYEYNLSGVRNAIIEYRELNKMQ